MGLALNGHGPPMRFRRFIRWPRLGLCTLPAGGRPGQPRPTANTRGAASVSGGHFAGVPKVPLTKNQQAKAQLRAAFSHRVKVRPPGQGKLPAILGAAAQAAGIGQWNCWAEGGRTVFGFKSPEHAEVLRAWLLEQGWADLLT